MSDKDSVFNLPYPEKTDIEVIEIIDTCVVQIPSKKIVINPIEINNEVCCICLETIDVIVDKKTLFACKNNHSIHYKCMEEWINVGEKYICPVCRIVLSEIEIENIKNPNKTILNYVWIFMRKWIPIVIEIIAKIIVNIILFPFVIIYMLCYCLFCCWCKNDCSEEV